MREKGKRKVLSIYLTGRKNRVGERTSRREWVLIPRNVPDKIRESFWGKGRPSRRMGPVNWGGLKNLA